MEFRSFCFYFPFMYAWGTRFSSLKAIYRLILIYIIPTLLIAIFQEKFIFSLYAVSFFYTYNLYEFGYIENDCETIKKENEPTLRLTKLQFDYYERHKSYIYISRLIWHIILFILLSYIGASILWLCYAMILIPVYFVYNRIRNKWNMPLYMFQIYLRYSVPVFISIECVSWQVALIVLLIYPYPTYIQRCVKGRFGYINKFYQKYALHDYNKFHFFRRKYYTILFVITFTMVIYGIFQQSLLSVSAYMMLFTFYSCYKHNNNKDIYGNQK